MRGTTVLVAALVLTAAPVGAQDFVWTSDRPDGIAPMGILADRTLMLGEVEVGYRFVRDEAEGLRLGSQPFTEFEALSLFTFVPLARTVEAHVVSVGYGITDDITLMGSAGWISKTRQQANEEFFFETDASGISDVEVDALWSVYDRGAYRGHVMLGAVIPVGSVEQRGDLPETADVLLPYDMQIGGGSFALVPGVAAQVMNEVGSVGAQIRAVLPLMDNDRDYRLGNQVVAHAWAAYRFNDFVSASGGVRAMARGAIEGADPDLETLRDPADLGLSFAGNRVDLPAGLNIHMTEGPLAGHRFGVEFVWTVHEDVDGPLLASDWGFILGWQKSFGF